jgi:hypothetical protein
MKNSTIYVMALASVLVLSLVDVEARGLGAQGNVSSGRPGGGAAHSAPSMSRPAQVSRPSPVHVQSPQRSQQLSRPAQGRVQSPQRVPQASRPSPVHVQSPQRSQQLSRPAQGHVQAPQRQLLKQQQAPQRSQQVDRPSQVHVPSPQRVPQASRPSQAQVQSLQKLAPLQSKSQGVSQPANKLPVSGIQPGTRPSGTTRPTPGQVQHFLNLPKPSEGSKPGLGTLGVVAGGAAAALALQRLAKPGGGNDHRAIVDPGLTARPGMGDNRRGDHAQVAQQIRNNYRQQNMLDSRWGANHPRLANDRWHNQVWRNHDWNYWWRPATWAIAAGWLPWGWSSPMSYDFGDNVLYDNNIVYMNGQQVATADEYYQQATQLASTAKIDTTDKTEWLPLGVWALSRGDTGVSNTVLQLAVSKQGVISGTYYNSDTDIARPVKGAVDKKTQLAAWTFADGKDTNIVMEAGINNLTQDQTEALFHFGKDITQQWLMVRLQEPPATKTEPENSAAR